MRKPASQICPLLVLAYALGGLSGGCAEAHFDTGPDGAVVFAEIGTGFFQESLLLLNPDTGFTAGLLLPPQPGLGYEYAQGYSLRGPLLVLAEQAVSTTSVENHLYLYSPSTRRFSRLVQLPGSEGLGGLSPDQNRAAFQFLPAAQPGQSAIWVDNIGSNQAKALTSPGPSEADTLPVWKPDGTSVLFIRFELQPGFPHSLMEVPAAGGEPQMIFGPEENIGSAFYSPDGKQLAFWSKNGLETIRLSDQERTVILPLSQLQGYFFLTGSLFWSPTGHLLTFALLNGQTRDLEIWTIHPDGSDPRAAFKASQVITLALGGFIQN